MPQGEDRALACHRLPPERTRGKDENVPKDLLGEIPVHGCGAPTDLGRIKQGRHQNPRLLNDLFGVPQFELDRDVGARSDAPKPALLRPARKKLSRLLPGDRQRRDDVIDMDDIARRVNDGGQSCLP